MRRADFETLVASGGLPTLLAHTAADSGKAKATTLSGHYYQQKFGEDIASHAGQG